VELKNEEGRIWGAMMGPFGGGYAIRRELFFKIPPNFLVDDFYINMKILEKGFKAINNPQAFVYEDVSNNLYIEFKRKIRIATGNFQNLKFFAFLLFPLTKGLAFCFLSHKVLRWIAPIFLITALISNILLASISFYKILLVLYLFTFIIPIIDGLLRKLQIDITLVRFFTHFYSMNIALLLGFFKYLKGVKSNVWQPTKRHQG
jgi:cellulose synthase/poly-beta-1,6-N-acetylglucosamine synthase-like glycosyltransferase